MKVKPIIFLTFLLICSYSTHLDDITTLHGSLYSNYWSDNTTFKILRTWQHMQGLFQSNINQNFVDDRNGDLASAIRQLVIIDDQNMFVTNWVLYGLLDAEQLGTIKTDQRFGRSLQAIASFRDKNQPEGVPQYTFWPQKLINGVWSSASTNIFSLIDLIPDLSPQVQRFFTGIGLGIWTTLKEQKKQYHLPPSLHDSSANIALLGYLKEIQSKYYSSWQKQNANLDAFYKRVLKYAYRPFSPINSRSDEIDPRSYFILHDFLKQRKAEAYSKKQSPRLILPTVWVMNRDETIIDVIRLPLDANNVDANSNADFLFGLIFQIKGGYKPSAQLRETMRDVTDFLVYTIEDAIYRRPDLILAYYPSKYSLYWLVARIVGLLQRMKLKCEGDADLKYVYDKLAGSIRSEGTRLLLKEKHDHKLGYYWAEFLGNYVGKNRNEDALYSTAVVLNVLLNAWGVQGNKSFKYLSNTPKDVKDAVSKGISYLKGKFKTATVYQMGNVILSSSLKIASKQFPPNFPANKLLDKNNRPINAQSAKASDVDKINEDVVKGYIKDEDYQRMLKLKWFQADVPLTFNGYNDGEGDLFMYWSSPAITQIMMITALSKYYRATQ